MKPFRPKKVTIVLAVAAILIIAAFIIIPKFFDLNRYNGLIVHQIQKATGGTVRLGNLSWSIAHQLFVKVDGVSSAFQKRCGGKACFRGT